MNTNTSTNDFWTNNPVNQTKMALQEKFDFERTELIMNDIFEQYNANVTCTQMPHHCTYDATMKAKKNQKENKYIIEIKERNQNKYELQTLQLKVSKWGYIMANKKEDETPLVVYLVNDIDYYIFNLADIPQFSNIRLWHIKKFQYSNSDEYEDVPAFFIPVERAKIKGKIYKNEQCRKLIKHPF